MIVAVINCSRRKDGFSSLVSSMVSDRFGCSDPPLYLHESSYDSIQDRLDLSSLAVIACPVFSSDLVPSFWDLLDNISCHHPIPCILVVSCGQNKLFCRSKVRTAADRILRLGFSHVEILSIDSTYGLVKGELLPKHISRFRSACDSVLRYL